MINAFGDLLCSKLCQHNKPVSIHHANMKTAVSVVKTKEPLKIICLYFKIYSTLTNENYFYKHFILKYG